MTGKVTIFTDSLLNIEGSLVRWEKHTCFISAVSHIWVGKLKGKWGTSKETEYEGLNIELISGSVYSFQNSSSEFLMEAYETFCTLLAKGFAKGLNTLDFKNNLIQIYKEPVLEQTGETRTVRASTGSPLIDQELTILIESCKKKEEPGSGVLQLLDEIVRCYNGQSSKNIQDLFMIFVQLSLINECNELGLNALIEEVKSKLYR